MPVEHRREFDNHVISLRKHLFLQNGDIRRTVFQGYNLIASIVSTGRINEDQLKAKVGLK